MKRALVIEPQGQLAERLIAAVSAAGVQPVLVGDPSVALTTEEYYDAVLVGPTLVDDPAFAICEQLSERCPVVFVARAMDAEVVRRAMRAGAVDIVSVTEPMGELSAAVGRAVVLNRHASETSPAEQDADELARVVTVFSTKGGVGKTVVATNLAVALAKDGGGRVALIDLDLEFGDVAIMMGLRPEHTIHDAVLSFDRLDADMLTGLMTTHSSGVNVLLAPVRPEDAEEVSAGRVGELIDLVRAHHDVVVIDTCPSFTEPVLAALDRSDDVALVTMMDLASIKNARVCLQKLKQLGYDNGRVSLVLNRSDSKVLLAPAEVEEAIGQPISVRIPSDRIVPRSVNKGVPVVSDAPRSDVSRSLINLARMVTAHAKEAAHVT